MNKILKCKCGNKGAFSLLKYYSSHDLFIDNNIICKVFCLQCKNISLKKSKAYTLLYEWVRLDKALRAIFYTRNNIQNEDQDGEEWKS